MLIENSHPAFSRRRISVLFQNDESARNSFSPVAPARATRAISSSTNRTAPRLELALPLRSRTCSTSPLSAREASSG
jgi:hypothetical protein